MNFKCSYDVLSNSIVNTSFHTTTKIQSLNTVTKPIDDDRVYLLHDNITILLNRLPSFFQYELLKKEHGNQTKVEDEQLTSHHIKIH